MFRGYIQTRRKKPVYSVKEKRNWDTLENAKRHYEYGGILNQDLVMVDIDKQEQAKLLEQIIKDFNLKCHILHTSRGMHFYFINPGTVKSNKINFTLPIGLEADIKLGSNNTVVPLKLDGKERDLVQVDQPDILPKWLTPIENPANFYNMGEGDGRNQALFNYILTLMSAGFSKDEVKETIEIINEYVLKVPLPKAELEVILRDEAFDKPVFFIKGKFQVELFSQFLIREYNVIKLDGGLHVYENGVYVNKRIAIERAMNREIPSITRQMANEVYWKLEILAEETQLSPPTHIVLENGLYNVSTRQLEDFRPSYVCKNKIHTSYNPEAYSKDVDDMLGRITCNDQELRALLEEVAGYTLARENKLGKSFVLTGIGSNGKSTFLEMIDKMVGDENISYLSLQELGQRFKTAELEGKLINIGDDIPAKYIEDNSVFKKLVTGEKITVERKGADPFDFRNYAKLFFSANEMPRIQDYSYGLLRRLVIIPFNADFKRDGGEYDPFIIYKLTKPEALEYLLRLGLEGLNRVLENQHFTEVSKVAEALKEYNLMNNPILQFLEEGKIINELVPDVYRAYQVWCVQNGYRDVTKNKFNIELKKHYDTKKQWSNAQKKVVTVYVEKQ